MRMIYQRPYVRQYREVSPALSPAVAIVCVILKNHVRDRRYFLHLQLYPTQAP